MSDSLEATLADVTVLAEHTGVLPAALPVVQVVASLLDVAAVSSTAADALVELELAATTLVVEVERMVSVSLEATMADVLLAEVSSSVVDAPDEEELA